MPTLLEVIVTSVEEAQEAEAGGADRLELVRALDLGGLTPALDAVAQVVKAVAIPVRVMLRENVSLSLGGQAELGQLGACAAAFAQLNIGGFVLGFAQEGRLDIAAMRAILERAPNLPATCHRAFEQVHDPLGTITDLKQLPQIDRILTSGGEGSWVERVKRLKKWQAAASPEIQLLVGIGLCSDAIEALKNATALLEVHVGRAGRVPQTNHGVVSRERIRALKSALQ